MTKRKKKLHRTVEKVIKPTHQGAPEKAQIGINEADHLYREVRVENVFTDEAGDEASLKPRSQGGHCR